MTRYAKKRPSPRGRNGGWLSAGLSSAAVAISRNPLAVGGTTGFLVSLAFVSANALFYQPQVHPSAFLSTRVLGPRALPNIAPEHPLPETAPRNIRQINPAGSEDEPESTGSVPAPTNGDPTVRAVQTVLSELSLYRGPLDGMAGPQTDAAVETYRRIVGLEAGTQIDAALLHQLGIGGGEAARPATDANSSAEDDPVQTASAETGNPEIQRIQAGLKAFGNDGIEVDGKMGERTREAIREFQSLFGLPVTGEPDGAFVAKMQEIGLIN